MSETVAGLRPNRWLQLLFGVICMCMIANLQYGWTFFVNPMQERHGWDRAAIQVAFTIFVVTETWLVPIEGWFVDKYGPRIVTLFGGLLCGIAWVMNSYAQSLTMLYVAAAIGGTGAGAVYGTCVGNSLKWFPDRRGLAAGVTAMGFGAGSALTVVPIQALIQSHGYEAAFFWFGIGQGAIVMLIALFLLAPKKGEVPEVAKVSLARRDYTWSEMAGTPVFWVMYLMFVMMAAGGLMATAQLGPIAKDFKIAEVPVSLIGITLPALDLRGDDRPGAERGDAAVLRLGVGPHRAREHHVPRLRHRGRRHLGAQRLRAEPAAVRDPDWARVLRLGRDLQPVPGDLRRYLRHEVRGDERRAALYREGHGGADRTLHQRPHHHDRELARGLPCRSRAQHRGGPDGDLRPEADAEGVRQARGRAGGAGDDRARPRRVKRATSDRNGPARTSGRPSCIGARLMSSRPVVG